MQLFGKKSLIDEIEAEIVALRRRRDRRASDAAAAQSELDAVTAAQRALLTDADEVDQKSETAAQRRVDSARSARERYSDALSDLEARLADAERRAGAERDDIARRACVREIEDEVKAAEDALEPAISAFKKLFKSYAKLGDISYDCGAISRYAETATAEIELAAGFALAGVRAIAQAISNGDRRIPKRQTEQTAPALLPSPEPLEGIFLVRSIAYTNSAGTLFTEPANFDVALPPAVAAQARECGAAIEKTSERAKKIRAGQREPKLSPVLERCICLDDGAKAKRELADRADVQKFGIAHDALEVVDRGEPFVLHTPGGNPMPAQVAISGRSIEEE